ncbi:ARMADILLO REPEAT ONLY 4 [Salix viminalis]|uniref:ARMADILLO REPEAT ONLY 4 n=1 Tax=Salix viminalis TaxID=40686 RepID=A0A9Q0U1S0_SALVM|nr:ARMADILLO REPEAT ONLY 4 [Salix viminalis]
MAECNPIAQDDFARENAIRPLVTLLSFETFTGDQKSLVGKQSIHSLVQINQDMDKKSLTDSKNNHHYRPYVSSFSSFHHSEGSSKGGSNHRRERENAMPEVKHELKISCAEALWMLARGSVLNSKRITDTKGLLCLAKLVENGEGELQFNCLMTIKEITSAADPKLQVPAIRSIGSLARTFPAKETRVVGPLVAHLSNRSQEVTAEAAIALGKFATPENFLCDAHSKAIIEFNGVPPLMRLLRGNEREQLHGLVLLCYLALHAGNSEALEQARVLNALEGVDQKMLAQFPDLKELVFKAVCHINLYHAGPHSQRLLYVP